MAGIVLDALPVQLRKAPLASDIISPSNRMHMEALVARYIKRPSQQKTSADPLDRTQRGGPPGKIRAGGPSSATYNGDPLNLEGTLLKERIWDTLLTRCLKEALPDGQIR